MQIMGGAAVAGLQVAPHWNANIHVHLASAHGWLAVEYLARREDIFNFERLLEEGASA